MYPKGPLGEGEMMLSARYHIWPEASLILLFQRRQFFLQIPSSFQYPVHICQLGYNQLANTDQTNGKKNGGKIVILFALFDFKWSFTLPCDP